MSIKTLRKRIALVAVSALGVGLLSVAPANADALAAGEIVDATVAAGVNSTLVCLQTGAATSSATPNVVANGGSLQFNLSGGNGDTAFAVISGPADWLGMTAVSGFSRDVTGKKLTVTDGDNGVVPVLRVTGTGAITVTWYESDGGAVIETYYITAVSACVTGVQASTSYVQVSNSSTKVDTQSDWITRQTATGVTSTVQTATTTVAATTLDNSLDVRTEFANTQEAYIAVRARDAYTANISGSANVLSVSCTNGARVAGSDSPVYTDTSFSAATTSSGDNNVAVSQPVDGVAATSACSVTVNGVLLATKTIKWAGDLASITIAESRIGEALDSTDLGRITYVCKDAAGNSLNCSVGATSDVDFGNGHGSVTLTSGSGGTMVTAIAERALDTTLYPAGQAAGFGANSYIRGSGVATFQCNDYGTKSISVYAYSTAGVKVTSNSVDIRCEDQAIHTWTASLDKASYKKGEVATLTITGKGSGGLPTAYGTTLGSGLSVALPGMTAVTAPSIVDTESAARTGTWVYTYTVNDSAEGNYTGAVKISVGSTSPQYTKAVTVPYTIQGSGAVSNAEVLAAIVKLIASINKQIKALQKSLRR